MKPIFNAGINAVEIMTGIAGAALVNRQFTPNLYTLRLNRLEYERDAGQYSQEFKAAHHSVLGGFLATAGLGALLLAFPKGRDTGVVMVAAAGVFYFAQRRFLSKPCGVCEATARWLGHE